jgi:hypothetical protein
MKRIATALALSTLCLALSACGTDKYTAQFIPTPPNRLICDATNTRPAAPGAKPINWAQITTVAQAKVAHEDYVKQINVRDGIIAGYVIEIEGRLFNCFNNMQWRREFEADLAKKHPPAQ